MQAVNYIPLTYETSGSVACFGFHDERHAGFTALRELVIVGFVTRCSSSEHDVVSKFTTRGALVGFWIMLQEESYGIRYLKFFNRLYVTLMWLFKHFPLSTEITF